MFFCTAGSHEQCTRPSCWTQMPDVIGLEHNPSSHYVLSEKLEEEEEEEEAQYAL